MTYGTKYRAKLLVHRYVILCEDRREHHAARKTSLSRDIQERLLITTVEETLKIDFGEERIWKGRTGETYLCNEI